MGQRVDDRAEVKDPRRNYIRAMVGAVAVVTISYVLPIAIVAMTGIPAASFATGAWVDAARTLAGPVVGPALALCVVAGGAITGVAMFNALTLSYARVPAAMAKDGMLPKQFARHMDNGVSLGLGNCVRVRLGDGTGAESYSTA